MRRDDSSPDAYVADVDGKLRPILEHVRAVVRAVAPEIPEGMAHGMLDYPGLCNLGAQKHHVALYVAPAVLARYGERFGGARCGKSCLRLTRLEQADTATLTALLSEVRAFRAAGLDAFGPG